MRPTVVAALDAALRWSPAQPLFLRRAGRRLTVLAYHGIDEPTRFVQHLDYLAHRLRPVSLDDVIEALIGGVPLPERAVLITFDDGERSVLDRGAELMRARNLPGVAFVIAGLLDTDELPWWREVEDLVHLGGTTAAFPRVSPKELVWALKKVPDDRRLECMAELRATASGPARRVEQLRSQELPVLEAAGIAIGNHSLTHPCVARCDDVKVEQEIFEAHRILTDALGRPPAAFAYPDGGYDERACRAIARAGYRAAFVFDHDAGPLFPPHPLCISRLRVNSTTRLDRFATIVSGLHPVLHRARGRT